MLMLLDGDTEIGDRVRELEKLEAESIPPLRLF